ncbi:MAG: IPT/TIG domain-containing protein [Acidimicrobiales bacterium]
MILLTAATIGVSACAPASQAPDDAANLTGPHAAAEYPTGLLPVAVAPAPQVGAMAVATPPASVDLTQWAPPAGDQGNVGSCVAWSIAYTALGWYQRHDKIAGGALAPMYTYAQIAKGNDNGSTFAANLNIATSQGVDTQADYKPQGNFDFTTQPTAAQKANAAKWKLSNYKGLAVDQVAIETSLAAGHPVVIGMAVYNNFFSVGTANHGFYDGISGSFAGYHAITALGYDTTGLRIENSWSSRWGDQGFATLSWNFVRNYVFSAIEVGAFAPGAPADTTPTPPAPPVVKAATVASMSPTTGPIVGGQVVTLTGTGFSTATGVTVGGVAATGLTANTAGTQLKITVPAHDAGAAPIVVTNAGGASAVTTANTYRYLAPSVTTMLPAGGTAAGGTKVTVNGANLTGAAVRIGSVPVAATVASNGANLTFVTPAGTGANAVTVTVGSVVLNAGTFTFVPAPTLTGISVDRGKYNGVTPVTITGTDFGPTAKVLVGVKLVSPTKIAADGRSLVVTVPVGTRGVTTIAVRTDYGISNARTWTWF